MGPTSNVPRTERAEALDAALRRLLPRADARDRRAIQEQALASRGLRKAAAEHAAWLSALAYIRHTRTDYDALLAEGYGPEAARHFTADAMDAVLEAWGSRGRVARNP